MGKAEIIAELAHLSREDLAEVRAWLDHIESDQAGAPIGKTTMSASRLRSPRLVDRSKVADFKKQVMELSAHATL